LKEFADQLYQILTYGSIVLAVFVALLLNNRRTRKSQANLFLSILLIALAFSVLHTLFARSVLDHFSINARTIGDPTFLLIAPALWFYIRALTGSVQFNAKMLLHFIPFVFLITYFLGFKYSGNDNVFAFFWTNYHRLAYIIFWIVVVIQFSCYLFFIHRRWLAYRTLIVQEVSNTEDVDISWVKFFMTVFLVINFLFLINLIVVIHVDSISEIHHATAFIFSLSVFALGYRGVLQKELFHTNPQDKKPADAIITTPLTAENKTDQQLVDRLLNYMKEKEPFLDPELTLSTLAKQLEISRGQLSQLINEGIGDNFYNFVNRYRVEQVKKYMNDPSKGNLSMLGIALDAGFKSKSTFNLIFKRFTGLTPTEYRKNLSR
jgi:AraC-like DNA-binding protein